MDVLKSLRCVNVLSIWQHALFCHERCVATSLGPNNSKRNTNHEIMKVAWYSECDNDQPFLSLQCFDKKYQIKLDRYIFCYSLSLRSRWEGGWMAADKPAPSSTLKLPARTNRDLLELWFLQSLNFKKSSFPKCFLKVLPSQFWIIHLKNILSKSLKMWFGNLPTAFKFIIILPHKLSERIKLSKVTKYPSTDIDILAQPQLGWAPL